MEKQGIKKQAYLKSEEGWCFSFFDTFSPFRDIQFFPIMQIRY